MSYSQSLQAGVRQLAPRKKPLQSRATVTVQAILEGAAHILEADGFEGYTTNQIASRAGVSIGSLYQYFPGKDAVTLALIERESTILVDEVQAALAVHDPAQALRGLIEAAVRHQLRRPKLARLLDFEEARLAPVMPRSGNAAAVRAALVSFLRNGYGIPAQRCLPVATHLMEITRALTDASSTQPDLDATLLACVIEGAVLGYLKAISAQASTQPLFTISTKPPKRSKRAAVQRPLSSASTPPSSRPPTPPSRESFERIRPLLEGARMRTKPATVDLYDVWCAVLHMQRTGCSWRQLPAAFPKWRTVHSYFAQWREPGADGISRLERALTQAASLATHTHAAGRAKSTKPAPSRLARAAVQP